MKLITILTAIAGLSLAAFALGLTFDHFEFPLFVLTFVAWFMLLTVHAYVPASRSWQPRLVGIAAATRRVAPLSLAV
jgi:hypothetical protein